MVHELMVTIDEPQGDSVRVSWIGFDELIPVEKLFDRSYSDSHLLNNIRLGLAITNQVDPSSEVFRNVVRARGGIHGCDRTYYLGRCRAVNGLWFMPYGVTEDDASNEFSTPVEDLMTPAPNQNDFVVRNVATFLRLRGYTSLTPQAREAVSSVTFRSF